MEGIAPLNYTASHEAPTYRTVTVPAGSETLNFHVKFYVRGSVHRNSRLKKYNKMQQYADIHLLINYSTCFGRQSRSLSGVHKTVVAASSTDHTIWGASFLKCGRASFLKCGHVLGSLLPTEYDLYQRLQLQFYVHLLMGAMDARNMYSNLAVNEYLHTVASCWISSN